MSLVIDVRSREEFEQDHAENTINIPLEEFEDYVKTLDKNTNIEIVCRSGKRAGQALFICIKNNLVNSKNVGSYLNLKR